ncbi:DUF1700 domain-containing protein [Nesterenkonia muleiensis]|uniref:DUF1700 domain-containing protein n=1 Tax=Nesterenkonia muleiensis TaxID=2282648 RepID=UPI0013005257|nr:hypothetical protein [Nesterenkonia muleiensis]
MSTEKSKMSETPGQQLAEAYLRDLERALSGTDPREREETLAEIEDQLRDAEAVDPQGAEVRRVIDRLGSVEAIAAVASPDEHGTGTPAAVPGRQKDWFVIGTTILSGVALVTTFLFFPVAAVIALVTFVLGIVQLFTSRMGKVLPVLSIVFSAIVLVLVALAIIGLLAWQETDSSYEIIEDDAGEVEEGP